MVIITPDHKLYFELGRRSGKSRFQTKLVEFMIKNQEEKDKDEQANSSRRARLGDS